MELTKYEMETIYNYNQEEPLSDWGNRFTRKGIDSYIPPKEYLHKENSILWWADLPEPPKEVNDI